MTLLLLLNTAGPQPAFRAGSAAAAAGEAGSATLTVPTAVQAGDLMIAVVSYRQDTATATIGAPAGWEMRPLGAPVPGSGAAFQGAVLVKSATEADRGAGLTVQASTAAQQMTVAFGAYSFASGNPRDVVFAANGTTADTSITCSAGQVQLGDRVVVVGAVYGSTAGPAGEPTFTGGPGVSVRAQAAGAAAAAQNVAAFIGDSDSDSAGARTVTASRASWAVAGQIVLRAPASVRAGRAVERSTARAGTVVQATTGDLLANAVILQPGGSPYYGDTTRYSFESGELKGTSSSSSNTTTAVQQRTMWFRWLAPADASGKSYTFSTTLGPGGTAFDTYLSLFRSAAGSTDPVRSVSGLELFASNDDGAGGALSSITTTVLEPGRVYYLQVGGYATSNFGPFGLTYPDPAVTVVVTAGRAVERSTARVRPATTTVAAGRAVDRDTARPGSGFRTAAAGAAVERDQAVAGTAVTAKPGGRAVEQDHARAGAGLRVTAASGRAVELAAGRAGVPAKQGAGGRGEQADRAVGATVAVLVTAGRAVDRDTARAGTAAVSSAAAAGRAVQRDAAVGGAGVKRYAAGTVEQPQTALPGAGVKLGAAGRAGGPEVAVAGVGRRAALAGRVVDVDRPVAGAGVKTAATGPGGITVEQARGRPRRLRPVRGPVTARTTGGTVRTGTTSGRVRVL